MKLIHILFNISLLDEQIDKLKALRDSYRQANVDYYGEYLAKLLDE